jgi:hypothetical protein
MISCDKDSCSPEQFLIEENAALRRAGCKMAEAALHVAREYDGVHRLMLAVSEWAKAIANEGGRGKTNSSNITNNESNNTNTRRSDMPYITQDQRDKIEDKIQNLVSEASSLPDFDLNRGGVLNFIFTKIALEILKQKKKYATINDIFGALECCKLELYRRQVAPYEDIKIKENGDVT